MAGSIDDSVNINIYSAILSRHKSPPRLKDYLVGDDFRNYLFNIGFFQGVVVFFGEDEEKKYYDLDALPWLARNESVGRADVSDDERDKINKAFEAEALEEFQIIPQMLQRRSAAEREHDIIFVPSGEISAFTFHYDISSKTNPPSSASVRELAKRLGLLDDCDAPTERYSEMIDWLGRCAEPTSQVGCSDYFTKCLQPVLDHLARHYKTRNPTTTVARMEGGGVDDLTALAMSIFETNGIPSVQTVAVFNVAGHAKLRENETRPRSLLIYPIQDGPSYSGILFCTFENPSRTPGIALSDQFIHNLGPLLLASIFLLQDYIAVGDFVLAVRASLKTLSRGEQSDLRDHVRIIGNSLRNIWAHLLLITSSKPWYKNSLHTSIEENRKSLDEAVRALSDAYSGPWSVPRFSLANQSLIDALQKFVSFDYRAGLDALILEPLFKNIDEHISRAQDELERSLRRESGQVELRLMRSAQELEVGRPGEAAVKLTLNPRQVQVFENVIAALAQRSPVASGDLVVSVDEMFSGEPPDKKELAQFVYYLNKKVNFVSEGAIERLFVSTGYRSSQYRVTVQNITAA